MRVALAQISSTSDPAHNLSLVRDGIREAAAAGAALVVFPEGTMCAFGNPLGPVAEPVDGPWADAVRFPALFQLLAADGAQVIVLPASWGDGPGKREQWDLLVRARALDSTAYVAACDQADPVTLGREAGAASGIGASLVAGPLGQV